MAEERTPGAVSARGNFTLWWVPEGGFVNPAAPTVAELTAPTVRRVTYAGVSGGYTVAKTVNTEDDDRLTAKRVLKSRVADTYDGTFQHVFGGEDDEASTVLVDGAAGFLVERWAVPNAQDVAAADVVTVLEVTEVIVRKDPPTTGRLTKTVTPLIGDVWEDVAVVAAA